MDETCEGKYSKGESENDLYALRKEEELAFVDPVCDAASQQRKNKEGKCLSEWYDTKSDTRVVREGEDKQWLSDNLDPRPDVREDEPEP